MIERKPDGGLSERIDFIEMVGSPDDAELLCLLLELRRHREDKQGLIEQLEAAQRDAKLLEAANISLDAESCKLRNRAEAAEAELKRRGALEPDYILHQCGCCGHETTGRITRCPKCNYEPVAQRPLYDAAPAAATEKVVKLPELCVGVVQSGHAVMVPYKGGHWFNKTAILEALDAAGVKWEVQP